MTYSSTVPQAISALVAAFKGSPMLGNADPPVPVRDGPEIGSAQSDVAVSVGYTGDENESVVEGSASPAGLGGIPGNETYAVMCAAEAIVPASDGVAAARARVYALHAACGQVLAADKTLGGAVMSASMGISSLVQQQTSSGALVRVVFPVNISAFSGR